MIDKYPYPNLMKANSLFAVLAWLAFIITAVLYIFHLLGMGSQSLFINSFLLFIVFSIGHLILGTLLKCPNCGKRPTAQEKKTHSSSEKIGHLDSWAVAIINILFKRRFRCIHCGSDFSV